MRYLLSIIIAPEVYVLARIGLSGDSWSMSDWISGVGFLIEGLTVGLILLLVLQTKNWWGKLFASLLIFVYVAFLAVQSVSFVSTGGFLPWIAFENADNIGMLLVPGTMLFFGLASLYAVVAMMLSWKIRPIRSPKKRNFIEVLFLLVLLLYVLPYGAAATRQAESHGIPGAVPGAPPTVSMIRTLLHLPIEYSAYIPLSIAVNARDLFSDIDTSQPYPLIKERVYDGSFHVDAARQTPNVLIIFLEGISSRHVAAYDDTFPDLMPAVSEFAQHENSIVVDNYFSHTAATFHGLVGQLCSLYPASIPHKDWRGEFQVNLFCLSDLFRSAGYQTTFLDPHFKEADHLFAMLEQMNFDQVLTADDIVARYLGGEVGDADIIELKTGLPLVDDTMALADPAMFIGLSRAVEDWGNSSQPQMLGVYLFNTHAWLDTPEGGIKYGDGRYNGLNTIHQLDLAFGDFWREFRRSPAAEHTMVILTADHAKYHEPSYIDALEERGVEDYQAFFTDRIPLIIYDPRGVPHKKMDARNATSIDFAPTVAEYLQLPNERNPFMGSSLFGRQEDIGLVSFDNLFYLSSGSGLYDITASDNNEFVKIREHINTVHRLMRQDRIWPH